MAHEIGVEQQIMPAARVPQGESFVPYHPPVAAIGDELGFDGATDFVKFFRRETGFAPGAFRTRQTSD